MLTPGTVISLRTSGEGALGEGDIDPRDLLLPGVDLAQAAVDGQLLVGRPRDLGEATPSAMRRRGAVHRANPAASVRVRRLRLA